ncbi:MAG: hypothetical protein ACOYMG_29675, partial [Candidatus Methylumidiphilus sp.]
DTIQMLNFLSSLFTPHSAERPEALDDALIEKATERVVLGTDQRIRAVRDYQNILREPVVKAAVHVITLVDALPPPVVISPQAFSEDEVIRALFVSKEHLSKVLGGFNSVNDYLQDLSVLPPDDIYGLMTVTKDERTVFGMALEGEDLRRDVMQVSVNFSNHRYVGPADNEVDSRRELKKCAFDFLIEKSLERITGKRSKRLVLDRQKHLLQQKLDAMKSGKWGLGTMLDEVEGISPNLAALETKIEAIDDELGQFPSDKFGLVESLDCVIETLSNPADWLASAKICLRLDYRGIKVPESSSAPSTEINLTELISGTGQRRTVIFGRIARADIPEPANIWESAKHYY